MKTNKKKFVWPYGEFSDMNIFFITIFFLSENAATSGGRLAQFQY